jgi:hypothetical protein
MNNAVDLSPITSYAGRQVTGIEGFANLQANDPLIIIALSNLLAFGEFL